jgi:hypothetical protein
MLENGPMYLYYVSQFNVIDAFTNYTKKISLIKFAYKHIKATKSWVLWNGTR